MRDPSKDIEAPEDVILFKLVYHSRRAEFDKQIIG